MPFNLSLKYQGIEVTQKAGAMKITAGREHKN
jgi:hypothetical protein